MSLLGWIDAALVGTACLVFLLPVFHLFRVRPALRHLAWLVVALRFLVPATPGWSWLPLEDQLDTWIGALVPAMPLPTSVAAPDAVQAAGDEVRPSARTRKPVRARWIPLVAALWLAGALTLLSVRLGGYVRWLRAVGRGAPAPPWLARDTRVIAGRLGIAPPRTVVSGHVRTPVVSGVFRPLFVWPAEMSAPLAPAARRAVVAHEMAHLRRRDLWTGWLEMLVAALWWWYPPARRVCRELSAAAEEACDRWVLSLYPEHRRSYAEALYAVAAAPRGPSVPRLVQSLSARSVMERRLEGIARDRMAPQTRRGERALVMLGALVVLPAGVMSRGATPSGPPVLETSGILGRGEVRVTSAGAPVAEDDGWIVAFHTDADGGFRAVFATTSGASVVDGGGNRAAVESADLAWIRQLVRETSWSVEAGSRLSSSGALVPAGPHVHLASKDRTLAMWSGVATPFDPQGRPGVEATEARPVVVALWSTGEPVRLYRFWRDERGRTRGERFDTDGRDDLADAARVSADISAAVRAGRAR